MPRLALAGAAGAALPLRAAYAAAFDDATREEFSFEDFRGDLSEWEGGACAREGCIDPEALVRFVAATQ